MVQSVHADLEHRNSKDVITELQKKYWFRMMGNIVNQVLSLCQPCQIHSIPIHQQALPLPHVLLGKIFVKFGIDFVGPLARTANKNQYLVTAIDYGTGSAYANPILCTSSSAVNLLLKRNNQEPRRTNGNRHGNGSEFVSCELKHYFDLRKRKHNKTTAHQPQENGLVKKSHGTLMNSLKKACRPYNQSLWDEYINNTLFGYRVSFSASMNSYTYFMVYGAEVRLPSDNPLLEPSDENIELI